MSLTDQERKDLIEEAVQATLLRIPEVVGNLMANHAALNKLNAEFYKKYPDFRDHKEVVMSVVEKLEGENPILEYGELLDLAVPEIRRRIEMKRTIDMKPVLHPSRDFSKVDVSDNGEI